MYLQRTRFKREIVAEFLPPLRPNKKTKVIIFCDGAPGVPDKNRQMEFFSKKGFWTVFPRYRGTWESDGKFLQKSPHLDIIDVIDELYAGTMGKPDMHYAKSVGFKKKPDELFVIGTSFGGTAALMVSNDDRVTKAIAISPGIDWTKPGKDEPMDVFRSFTEYAFGNGYRTASGGWDKLAKGNFYNPINHMDEITGSKVLIIHAKDDTICPYPAARLFAETTQSKLVTLAKGGHLGSSLLMKPRFYNIFKKFIK